MANTRTASCACGAVKLEITGEPVVQGYCHCASCRAWSAQPFNAYTLWPTANVVVVQGEEHLGTGKRNENITNRFCTKCGGSVMAHSAQANLTDVFAIIIADFVFEPGSHVNYAERDMDIRDGLPKFRDMPEQVGGSGAMMQE